MTQLPFLSCLISVVLASTCSEGDIPNTHNHCVHVEAKARNWSDAEAFCTAREGHLTSVHNQFDNTVIRTLGEVSHCEFYWIGGHCKADNCSWTDGTPFDFTAWKPGQPNPNSSCIMSSLQSGSWSAGDCSKQMCFVCEMPKVMTDCADWYDAGSRMDGEYTITIAGVSHTVYCDMSTEGGGWTVIQRRSNGNESFWDRKWNEYKDGFGKQNMRKGANFWLGNELLHQLTSKDHNTTLRIELRGDRTPKAAAPDAFWWIHYNKFKVGPEAANYPLDSLYLDWRHVEGNASTGWYDLTFSVGAPFSTVDKINDPISSCVTKYKMGGWWLHYCALASLNGAYDIKDYTNGYGMFWIIDGLDYIIHPRETAMMLRPTREVVYTR